MLENKKKGNNNKIAVVLVVQFLASDLLLLSCEGPYESFNVPCHGCSLCCSLSLTRGLSRTQWGFATGLTYRGLLYLLRAFPLIFSYCAFYKFCSFTTTSTHIFLIKKVTLKRAD